MIAQILGSELVVLFPLWLTAILAGGVALYLVRFGNRPAVLPSIGLLLSGSWWCFTYSMELMSRPGGMKEFWVALEFLGIYGVPAFFFVLAASVSKQRVLIKSSLLYFVALSPLLESAIVWSNSWHGLFFTGQNYTEWGSLVILHSEFGLLFWVLTTYNYLLTLLAIGMLVWTAVHGEKYGRKIRLLIIISALLPLMGNVLYVFAIPPFNVLDPSPYACGLSALLLTYGVFGLNLIDTLPVARSATIQYMPIPYFVLDNDDRIADANDAALRLVVNSKQDPIASEFGWAVDAPEHLEHFLASGIDGECIVDLKGQDANFRTYRCRVTRIRDRREHHLCRVVHLEDITESERAITALRASEERYRQLVSLSPVGIFVHRAGIILFANAAAAEMVKAQSEEDFVNRSLLDFTVHRDVDSVVERIGKVAVSDELLLPEEFKCLRLDGVVVELEVSSAAIQYEGESARLVLIQDVTDRNRISNELKIAKEVAEDANKAKSLFLSSMSHELRTPLNAINGFSELLEVEHFGPLNEKQLDFVRSISKSGEHLLLLITDLMEVSKIDSGVVDLELVDVDIDIFLETTKSMVQGQCKDKDLTLEMPAKQGLIAVGDTTRCRQVLLNLLTNAIKFLEKGGRIVVGVSVEDESFVKISVRDTGPGIDPDEHEKIFSEFYQTDRVRDAALGGSGIGLALSRRLVHLHGGEIGVESQLGEGSTFWFTLPVSKAVSRATAESDESNKLDADLEAFPTHCHILVVEDDPTNLKVIENLLKIYHHDVAIARNGKEAIEVACRVQPQLILMDIQMPVMDGLEATRVLKELDGVKEIPIVALSASVDSEKIQHCMDAGSDAYLSKPIVSSALFMTLRRFLG